MYTVSTGEEHPNDASHETDLTLGLQPLSIRIYITPLLLHYSFFTRPFLYQTPYVYSFNRRRASQRCEPRNRLRARPLLFYTYLHHFFAGLLLLY